MSIMETTPGQISDRIISSIINWVCPKCGGYMMDYQCCGRCRRNWLPEWEWANNAKRISDNASPAHARLKAETHLPGRRQAHVRRPSR